MLVQRQHVADELELVPPGPARQRVSERHAPLPQKQQRTDRNAVEIEEFVEDLVEAPGLAGDVENRVELGPGGADVQRPEEGGHAGKGNPASRPLHERPQSIFALLATPVYMTVSSMSLMTT